jgi:translation initiation factor IF-2
LATKKIRVYELARELGVENQVVLDLCERLKIGVKSHSSSIDEPLADRVRRLADAEGLRREPEVVEEPVEEPVPEKKAPERAPAKAAKAKAAEAVPEPAPLEPDGAAVLEPVAAEADLAPVAEIELEPGGEPALAPHRVVRSTGVIPDPTLAPRPAPIDRPAAAAAGAA